MKKTVGMLILIMITICHNELSAQKSTKEKRHHYEFMLSPISTLENDTIVSKYEVRSTFKMNKVSLQKNNLLYQQLLKSQLELSKLETERKIIHTERLKESASILKETEMQFNLSIDTIKSLNSTKAQEEHLQRLNRQIYAIKNLDEYEIKKKAFGLGIYLGLHYEVYGRELSKYYENSTSLELGYGTSYKDIFWYFHINYGKLKTKNFQSTNDLNLNPEVDKTEIGTSLSYKLYDTHKWRISPIVRYDYAIVAGLLDERNTDNINGYNKVSAGVDIDYILSRRLCLRPGQLFSGKEMEDISIRAKMNIGYMELPHNIKGCLFEFGLVFNIYGRFIR
ncbi:hypothetical protein K5X82_15245 [Halosquirtibacter xylanolyticus]|uniref:hypothetical protein n=1 Tax=Halosquirtibacter xylanolyticus TaxID=3374599 RepID=UPI003749C90A|nr:hypothetical protein K5X82_15245 [Prolixibacteraceae bacterium]